MTHKLKEWNKTILTTLLCHSKCSSKLLSPLEKNPWLYWYSYTLNARHNPIISYCHSDCVPNWHTCEKSMIMVISQHVNDTMLRNRHGVPIVVLNCSRIRPLWRNRMDSALKCSQLIMLSARWEEPIQNSESLHTFSQNAYALNQDCLSYHNW